MRRQSLQGRVLPQADTSATCVWALGRVAYLHPVQNRGNMDFETEKLVPIKAKPGEKVRVSYPWLGNYPSLTDIQGTLVERVGDIGWNVEFEGREGLFFFHTCPGIQQLAYIL
mmetsp:Transcript_90002/g.240437  ORF Transcript_90002/g.240437 Transcript_90002/m.240437 type:complete len:113 (-) Transcript_90002:224-562(-)